MLYPSCAPLCASLLLRKHSNNRFTLRVKPQITRSIALLSLAAIISACGAEGATPNTLVG